MTASDDYPADGAIGGSTEQRRGLYEEMCDEIDRLRATLDDEIVKRDTAIHLGRLEFAQSGKWQEMAEDLWEELQEWHEPPCPMQHLTGPTSENCTCHRLLAAKWDEITNAADWDDDGEAP